MGINPLMFTKYFEDGEQRLEADFITWIEIYQKTVFFPLVVFCSAEESFKVE